MSPTIDVRTEVRKLADHKPVQAAAGAGLLATEALRELPGRFAQWRAEASVGNLSARATGAVHSARELAATGYDRLAQRGKRALSEDAPEVRGALNGKTTRPRSVNGKTTRPRSVKAAR
jgi:hypothetical protein